MPHSSHKKKPPTHSRKRQLLDAGDGWTTVVSSSFPKSLTSPLPTPTFEPATIPPGLTVEKLNDEYLRYKEMWERSECWSSPTDDVSIYAQDPVFNTLDISFLSSRSITVLTSPAALSHITSATFLFAPHCERSFLLPALEGKDPEVVMCNDVEASVIGYRGQGYEWDGGEEGEGGCGEVFEGKDRMEGSCLERGRECG
ncbi:hypothetical protein FGG08_004713 [Glutinoglossum americanum]|uniref:SRR1-like domain-containing protein n=1 Tax=Glutinoglossum americanum TaxID=1670608 RepID=A0A9P8L272_9PEZI|nr:hypothetical protein FGG08_004713 [Glutinoglossum americanum]